MVYVSGGQMLDAQSPWRMGIVGEFFWGIVNFIGLFFQSMVNPSGTKKGSSYSSDYRLSGRGPDPFGPGGGGPRRRMGGMGRGGGGPSAPPMAGGG